MRNKKPREMEADLDMTTFINLMVVLLAFLLLTAVFTEIVRLNVNLPSGGGASSADTKPAIVLEVLIFSDRLIVSDELTGPMKVVRNLPTGPDFRGLKDFLITVKELHPEVKEITLLLEQNTAYETLIGSMDAVRYRPKMVNGKIIQNDLFSDISIGNAPPPATFGAPAGAAP